MSFPDPPPPFTPPPFAANNDASDFWPHFPMNDEQSELFAQFEYPPFKRPRNFEESTRNAMPYPPMNQRIQPPFPPINNQSGKIFFKTRLCAKYKMGLCRNGANCNFAHGFDDMRKPPPNWQELVAGREEERGTGNWDDDQKIIHKLKLCKKFYNGEECPFGERCNFLHESPSKFRDDLGRYRESSAISIGTTGSPIRHSNDSDQIEGISNINGGLDLYRVNMTRASYWKTKLCTKWETTSQCPFGDKCHFAHGQAELQGPAIHTEGEVGFASSFPLKPLCPSANNDAASSSIANIATSIQEAKDKKPLKGKIPKKLNRIYADWIDDLSP